MSKAFTKEDDSGSEILVSPRAPLPQDQINYVTAKGLALLKQEQVDLLTQIEQAKTLAETERKQQVVALNQRLSQLEQRLTTAQVVTYPQVPVDVVRFGASVLLIDEMNQQQKQYRIVGVDEAAPSWGDISFLSPLAKQLLGAKIDDEIMLANDELAYYIEGIEYHD